MICALLGVIAWFVRRRSQKLQNGAEPITFSSLEEVDQKAYQKVDAFNPTLSHTGKKECGNDDECSEVLQCEENDI